MGKKTRIAIKRSQFILGRDTQKKSCSSCNPVILFKDNIKQTFSSNPYQSILSPKQKMSPDRHFKTFYLPNRHFLGFSLLIITTIKRIRQYKTDKFNRHFRQNPYKSILSPKHKMSSDGHFKTFYLSNRHFTGWYPTQNQPVR